MDFLQNSVQPYVDKLRPIAHSVGEEARAQCERIITRLDAIADAVKRDSTMYWRERPQVTLAVGASDNTITVPPGEQWELEAVTIVPTGAVGTAGSIIIGLSAGLPLWGGAHTGRPTTVGGSGVRFESGHTLIVTANETGALVMLQVRIERQAPVFDGYKAIPAEVPAEPGITPPNVEVNRHTGTWATR